MEENYIVKSERKKRLHFTLQLLIGLIVAMLIFFGFVVLALSRFYDDIQWDHSNVTYECGYNGEEDDYNDFCYYGWHDNGYLTVENGQCTIHKQKYTKTIKGYWDDDIDVWVDPIIKHKWITEPCTHEIHNYSGRYDFAFKTVFSFKFLDCVHFSYRFYLIFLLSAAYILFAIYVIITHLKNRKYEIEVTAIEVKGRLKFGKKVTIPAYAIESANKKGKYNVIIQTADEPKKFKFIKNSDEIIEAINNLDKTIPENIINPDNALHTNVPSLSQELKAYKDLLDSGIISEQEYLEKIKKYNEKTKEN